MFHVLIVTASPKISISENSSEQGILRSLQALFHIFFNSCAIFFLTAQILKRKLWKVLSNWKFQGYKICRVNLGYYFKRRIFETYVTVVYGKRPKVGNTSSRQKNVANDGI